MNIKHIKSKLSVSKSIEILMSLYMTHEAGDAPVLEQVVEAAGDAHLLVLALGA